MRATGKVKWFNDAKGFGFITSDADGSGVFVHFSAISSGGFRSLAEGDLVEFDLWEGPKGFQAGNVVRVKAAEQAAADPAPRLSAQSVSLAPERREKLLAAIERVRSWTLTDHHEIRATLLSVLEPLLAADGYELRPVPEDPYVKFDFFAVKTSPVGHEQYTLGGEFKLYDPGQAVDIEADRLPGHVLANTILSTPAVNRAMLFVNTTFTTAERAAIDRLAADVDLLDFDALTTWITRTDDKTDVADAEVHLIIREVSSTFARLIAADPRILDHLEWRDLERTVAEVFRGLGFSVELTPAAKDGGKDIVLECLVRGVLATYVVEIKHWRSGARVGSGALRDFLSVVVREKRDGGLFLSTFGYCHNAFAQLTEIDRRKLRFGQRDKVVALCRSYVKARSGIWSPPQDLTEVLYDGTLEGD
jgi:restriction system protein